jgi:hypothetical protein
MQLQRSLFFVVDVLKSLVIGRSVYIVNIGRSVDISRCIVIGVVPIISDDSSFDEKRLVGFGSAPFSFLVFSAYHVLTLTTLHCMRNG